VDVGITSKGFVAALVRDNRSSQRVVPWIKFVVPGFETQVRFMPGEVSELVIAPYLVCFNEGRGHWDHIIEPFGEHLRMSFSSVTVFDVSIESPVNVNLPLELIKRARKIVNEIGEVADHKDAPDLWLENTTGFDVTCRWSLSRHEKTVNLRPQGLVPLRDVDPQDSFEIEVQYQGIDIAPQSLVRPRLLLHSFVMVRRQYKCTKLIQFNSTLCFQNDLVASATMYVGTGIQWTQCLCVDPNTMVPLDPKTVSKEVRPFALSEPRLHIASMHATVRFNQLDPGLFPVTVCRDSK